MKNEIGRKLTSLTLLSILLASSVTFAAPGALPVAEAAHNANLFVSAENSQFNNYFAGPQVIEIVINDPSISDTDEGKGEPDVKVNDKKVRMVQATDGLWYAYVADRIQAQAADQTQLASSAKGLDFGKFCAPTVAGLALGVSFTDTVGVALASDAVGNGTDGTAFPSLTCAAGDPVGPRLNHVVRENKTVNTNSPTYGQIGITGTNFWPFIQLYDFSVGGNVVIKYNKGGGAQTTTLTFDTIPSNVINTALDRTAYPQGSAVHVTMTDPQLTIDPTDEDTWTWDTAAATNAIYYNLFTENGIDDAASATAQNLIGNLTTFMFEKNGRLTLNLAAQGATVGALGDNDDQVFPLLYTPNGGTINQQMTFVELGANTGVFGNYDESDNANLDILTNAQRGKSAVVRYNDVSKSIVVGLGFGTLDINVASGEWGSGMEVPVTLVDSDANKNSRADEDLDVNSPIVTIIPALKIGNPFTAVQGDTIGFFDGVVTAGTALGSRETTFTAVGNQLQFPTTAVEAFSQRAVMNFTGGNATTPFVGATGGAMVIDLNAREVEDLQAVVKDAGTPGTGLTDFDGLGMFNYDIRSLNTGATPGITGVSIYLLINRSSIGGASDDFSIPAFNDGGAVNFNGVTAVKIADTPNLSGLISLNATTSTTGPAGTADPTFYTSLYSVLNTKDDALGLMFKLNSTAPLTLTAANQPIVYDFFSFGTIGDGLKTVERINNGIYRFELEETGDNTSTFIGSAEFTMLNQLNIYDHATYAGLRTIDDEVTFIVHEDLTDEDAPRINYLDVGSDGVATQISDQQVAPTHSATVSLDKEAYKVADTVTVTVNDNDINVDSDTIDIFVSVFDPLGADPASDTVGALGLGIFTNSDARGRMLDITFDDGRWITTGCAQVSADTGLTDAGFTLVETGTNTGVFKGDFQIPADYCTAAAGPALSTTGVDIEVNYVDFRDASGETIEVGDGAGVRANTGSVSLDRTVYPVPFGKTADFGLDGIPGSEKSPPGVSVFPVHTTAFENEATGAADTFLETSGAETLPEGEVTTHIRVNDPDFDISASGEDKIQQNNPATGKGPVKIFITRGSGKVVLGYAGGPTAIPGLIDVADNNVAGTRELGPITEIAPNAGIFELDFDILYTDGPADPKCPTTVAFTSTDGTNGVALGNRFDAAPLAGNFCVLQGDILTVEYTDPTDSSGDPNTVTDSATFDLRNGVLQSDKSVYIIGADMIMTLIEPDLDLDSDAAESYSLDVIEWDSDADTLTMGQLGGQAAKFDPEPSEFRETGDSTGIFQVVVEIPDTLNGERLDRGEEIQLEYTDAGPSGADFVGDEDEDINLTIFTSNFGATVELDQKVYTWTDKVYITIVAPDHNFDSNLVDEIGDTTIDKLQVSTRGNKITPYKLTETGTDTGIFTGEVILTGFKHDADGNGDEFDAPGASNPTPSGTGPTDGLLPSSDDDGLSVSFEFTEDETVVGSALIRWNIGETSFLEQSYPASGQGVVRVVDPDMNLNPEAVDNFDVDVWSDSDAGGIDLTVTETNEATGIFEGTVFFTTTDESSGSRLRVAEGDTVTAEYEDNTLPSPYTTADELEISATTFIGSVVPALERAPASNPRVVDAFGNELDEVQVDQQVQIVADLANGQDRDQPFAYLVQVQNEDGVTVSLSWITGSLAPGQTLNPAQSWTPSTTGPHNVQIFVWESVDNPDALSPPVSTTVNVV